MHPVIFQALHQHISKSGVLRPSKAKTRSQAQQYGFCCALTQENVERRDLPVLQGPTAVSAALAYMDVQGNTPSQAQ